MHAIRERRSIKRFGRRPISREEIEALVEAAVLAPNHRMTEPWGFLILGQDTRRRYADLRAARKAAGTSGLAAEAVRAKVVEETLAVPCIVAVTSAVAQEPVVREEDFAATWMGIENLCLAATAKGLGTHIRTGALLESEELRRILGVDADRRVLAILYLGEPAETPAARPRTPASARTRWLP